MSKRTKYRVIEQKLEQMAGGPDVDGLWMDMRSRLDHHMPEEREKRRILWWWKNSAVFLAVPLAIFVSAVFFTVAVNRDDSQDPAQQSGTTSKASTNTVNVSDAADVAAAGTENAPAVSKESPASIVSARTGTTQQSPSRKTAPNLDKSQAIVRITTTNKSNSAALPAQVTAAATGNSGAYDAYMNPAAIMRKGLNNGRPTMQKSFVLLPVPGVRTAGFLFREPLQSAAHEVPAPANDALIHPHQFMRKGLNSDAVPARSHLVVLPVPGSQTAGFLFPDHPTQLQRTTADMNLAVSANVTVDRIMRRGLNEDRSAIRKRMVMLPTPGPRATGSLFLNNATQPQTKAYSNVPALPAKSKATEQQQHRYPSLSLSPSFGALPVTLQQRQVVGALTDTMTFPAATVLQNRLAFSKKFVVGAAVHMNIPVSSQEMSTVSLNGGKNRLFDYMPSIYGQYHFTPKMFVQSEFQFVSPQHTPKLTLASTTVEVAPNKRQVHSVVLTKFYYMNLPVSLHYKVLPNLYTGAGIQYSYLTRSMLMEENATWQNGDNGWVQKTSNATLHVKKNPTKETAKFKTGGTNNPTPRPVPTTVDMVAQKFKSNDWRFTYDLNYYRRRFNAGIRMNVGINNYIDTEVSGTNVPVRDRNKSFQLYVRYNIWQRKRS